MPAAFATFFLAALLGCVLVNAVPAHVFVLYATASTIAFVIYARDKYAAQRNQWRTRESTLHVFGLAGGWPGALIAQTILRHKSKKKAFQLASWMTVILNCCALTAYLFPGAFAPWV
jgi:uncharacterized membrane protein YsdA (DUF1294 family)